MAREGCLSIPDLTANVRRATHAAIEASEPGGGTRTIESEGFEARCLLHELDHLDGILFLDRVDSLKTDVFRRKRYAYLNAGSPAATRMSPNPPRMPAITRPPTTTSISIDCLRPVAVAAWNATQPMVVIAAARTIPAKFGRTAAMMPAKLESPCTAGIVPDGGLARGYLPTG